MFSKEFDIAVCGGGVAGIAAALAAARMGHKTVMIEKTIQPGGLATSGLILVYLPLCDGRGNQLLYGLPEELMISANKYGPCEPDQAWQKNDTRLQVNFSPGAAVLGWDELLEEAGVSVWLDTVVTGCNVENNVLKSIEVFNKSGKGEIFAKCFIDATGDADIAFACGNACHDSENAMVLWSLEHRSNEHRMRDYTGEYSGGMIPVAGNICAAMRADSLKKVYSDTPLSGKFISDFVLEGRRRYRRDLQKIQHLKQEVFPVSLQHQAPLRRTRAISGRYTLQTEDEGKSLPQAFTRTGDWRASGRVWEIPYPALLPDNVEGLLAAGRCISALDSAWEATRVIPVAAKTGEAAGIAAALSVEKNIHPSELDFELLAREMRKITPPEALPQACLEN
jgi:ribulose 1,5-bisphosphate synthetase/thiazole synthase